MFVVCKNGSYVCVAEVLLFSVQHECCFMVSVLWPRLILESLVDWLSAVARGLDVPGLIPRCSLSSLQ